MIITFVLFGYSDDSEILFFTKEYLKYLTLSNILEDKLHKINFIKLKSKLLEPILVEEKILKKLYLKFLLIFPCFKITSNLVKKKVKKRKYIKFNNDA
jgi:hypothetical protein